MADEPESSLAASELPEIVRDTILNGSGTTSIKMRYDDGLRTYETEKPFEGVLPNLERRWRETDSSWVREELARYQSETPCEVCGGARFNNFSRTKSVASRSN